MEKIKKEFEKWIVEYHVQYKDRAEKVYRYGYFKENLEYIETHEGVKVNDTLFHSPISAAVITVSKSEIKPVDGFPPS